MKKLLIVDDDAINRQILREGLQKDFQIFEASDGKEGARLCLDQEIDIVVTDMNMPFMNGDVMIAAIRKKRKSVKFVAVSASNMWNLPPDVRLFMKPYDVRQVKEHIDDCI